MTSARVHSAAAGLVLFAFAALSAASFVAVTSAALRLTGGALAFPIVAAVLGLEAAKIGLPVLTFRLLRQRERLAARISFGAWASAFAVCALASFAFFAAPHKIHAARSQELARKIAALKVIDRARDNPDLDYEDYTAYGRRAVKLRAEIADLRTQPPKTVVVGGGLAGQLLGALAVVAELLSAGGLLFLRWATLRDGDLPPPAPTAAPATTPTAAPATTPASPLRLVQGPAFVAATATPDPDKATAWLWPGVLPMGSMTLLTGQPKVGKSQIAIAMAAVTSAGETWPDGSQAAQGGVILAEVEDAFADTRARLSAAGADLSRVVVRDRESGPLDLSTAEGMAVLSGQAEAMGGVRLVVLSPLLAFFGRAGATDDATVRSRLASLLLWAAQNRVAVLGVLHPAKNPGKALESQFAGADAYRRAARSAFVAMTDASDPEPVIKRKRRVLVCAGVNGASDDFRLFYRIEGVGDGSTSRVVWLPGDDDEAGSTEGAARADDANQGASSLDALILALLADSPRSRKAMVAATQAAGWRSNGSLYAAAKRVGVVFSEKNGFGGETMWSLPSVHSSKAPEGAESRPRAD
jgi:hypothetical protein